MVTTLKFVKQPVTVIDEPVPWRTTVPEVTLPITMTSEVPGVITIVGAVMVPVKVQTPLTHTNSGVGGVPGHPTGLGVEGGRTEMAQMLGYCEAQLLALVERSEQLVRAGPHAEVRLEPLQKSVDMPSM